jgi:hypothetical protein
MFQQSNGYWQRGDDVARQCFERSCDLGARPT